MLELEEKFTHLQEQINLKKNLLLKKQKEIKKNAKTNEHLERLSKEYIEDFNKTGTELIGGLEMLQKHITQLISSDHLSELNKKDAEFELQNVKQEIKRVKKQFEII
jgi:hypothetical protein